MKAASKSLTQEQKFVVEHEQGHALVRAVPGSGKTTTLVKRVQRLITKGYSPDSILILMFNKSAAESFQQKLEKTLPEGCQIPETRTFHGMAFRLVREGQKQGLIAAKTLLLADHTDYLDIIRASYRHGYNHTSNYIESTLIEELELFISRVRSKGLTPSEVSGDPLFKSEQKERLDAYRYFCDLLDKRGFRTFDDLIIDAVWLLRNHPEFAPNFRQIIIDEYQDVNFMQQQMLRLIAHGKSYVMAVGDINQCIYEWRGSCPDFIGGIFERDFKPTKIYSLSCTFRYGHALAIASNSVISKNGRQMDRFCVSHPSTPKTSIQIHMSKSVLEVIRDVASRSGDCCIMARNSADLCEADLSLRLLGIQYKYLNDRSQVFARRELCLVVVGFLICIDGDLSRIAGHPQLGSILYGYLMESGFRWRTGMFNQTLDRLKSNLDEYWKIIKSLSESDIDGNSYSYERLQKLKCTTKSGVTASSLFDELFIKGFFQTVGASMARRQQNNDSTRGLAAIKRLLNGMDISADGFLDAVFQLDQTSTGNCEPAVQLSTVHGTKGLEWDKVIFLGLDEETIPGTDSSSIYGVKLSNSAVSQDDIDIIEEERRLFYVGITRAKNELHLLVPGDEGLMKWVNEGWSSTPNKTPIASRFVFELGVTGSMKLSSDIYSGQSKKLFQSYNGFYRKYLYDLSKV